MARPPFLPHPFAATRSTVLSKKTFLRSSDNSSTWVALQVFRSAVGFSTIVIGHAFLHFLNTFIPSPWFAGVTGFGAMASHIPDGGSCLVVYGPHVGVDYDGSVGKVNRRGKGKSGSCCGSAVAASGYVSAVYKGEIKEATAPTATMDAQQIYVGSVLLPYAERLMKAFDPMVELPYAMFEPVDDLTQKIVARAAAKVGQGGKIALLGGLQINTPDGISDYFLPLRFEVRDNQDKIVENLLYEKRF